MFGNSKIRVQSVSAVCDENVILKAAGAFWKGNRALTSIKINKNGEI